MEVIKTVNKKKDIKDYLTEFNKQLKEFKEADDHSEYMGLEFDDDVYLTRIFEMDVKEVGGQSTLKFGVSPITNEFKPMADIKNTKIFPIVKIIGKSSSEDQKYNIGDLLMVASADVIGDSWNPEFLQTLQFMENKGRKPIIPDSMRQRIPNIEVKWEHYNFVRPWVLKPEHVDSLTYLLPALAIKGRYNR